MKNVEAYKLHEGNHVTMDLGDCGYRFDGPAMVIIVKDEKKEDQVFSGETRGIIDSNPTL